LIAALRGKRIYSLAKIGKRNKKTFRRKEMQGRYYGRIHNVERDRKRLPDNSKDRGDAREVSEWSSSVKKTSAGDSGGKNGGKNREQGRAALRAYKHRMPALKVIYSGTWDAPSSERVERREMLERKRKCRLLNNICRKGRPGREKK